MRLRQILRYGIPVLASGSFIFFLSSLSSDQLPKFEFPIIDKWAHILVFAVFSFATSRALTRKSRLEPKFDRMFRSLALAVLITLIYGALDEWHQSYTPGRDVEVFDLIADFIGGLLGAALCYYYRRWVHRYETEACLRLHSRNKT